MTTATSEDKHTQRWISPSNASQNLRHGQTGIMCLSSSVILLCIKVNLMIWLHISSQGTPFTEVA